MRMMPSRKEEKREEDQGAEKQRRRGKEEDYVWNKLLDTPSNAHAHPHAREAAEACSNCEKAAAIYKCEQCQDKDAFFCEECWNVHVKVKAFKSHSKVSLPPPEPSSSSSSSHHEEDSTFPDFLNNLIESFDPIDFLTRYGRVWTGIFVLLVSFILHLLAKFIFGKNAVFLIIILGIILIKYVKNKYATSNKVVKNASMQSQLLRSTLKEMNRKEMVTNSSSRERGGADEFWYDHDKTNLHKQATFKRRVRPFQSRGTSNDTSIANS